MTEIKAVIWDVGGVIQLPKNPVKTKKGLSVSGVHSSMAKELGLSLDEWFDCIDTIYAKSIEGKISKKQTLTEMSRNLHITPKKLEKIIKEVYRNKYKKNNELYRFVLKLKKKNYKIAILSDQWHISKEALTPLSFTKDFDVSIISTDVGMRKPNPKIYKLTVRKLKLKAKECLFVDDRDWNLKPAEKLGIKTILYKNNKQLFKDLEKLGVK